MLCLWNTKEWFSKKWNFINKNRISNTSFSRYGYDFLKKLSPNIILSPSRIIINKYITYSIQTFVEREWRKRIWHQFLNNAIFLGQKHQKSLYKRLRCLCRMKNFEKHSTIPIKCFFERYLPIHIVHTTFSKFYGKVLSNHILVTVLLKLSS